MKLRLPELDFLRGVAILLVLGRHIMRIPGPEAGFVSTFFFAWRDIGWIGVDLFFVLSGFLVGGLLIHEAERFGEIKPLSFLLRRGLRIYPGFYFFLFASLLVSRLVHLSFPTWPSGFFYELFLIQNYRTGLWPQTWSLAVEEHFYLLLPFFMLWQLRRSNGKKMLAELPVAILVINAVVLLGRIIAGYGSQVPWSDLDLQTQWRLDSLFFGVLLAHMATFERERLAQWRQKLVPWRILGWPLLLAPSLIWRLESDLFVPTVGLTGLYLVFGWMLMDALFLEDSWKERLLKLFPFMPVIGRHSYAIYLWHVTAYYVVVATLHQGLHWRLPFLAEVGLYLGLSLGWGILVSVLLEKPVLLWRDRLIPSRSKAVR